MDLKLLGGVLVLAIAACAPAPTSSAVSTSLGAPARASWTAAVKLVAPAARYGVLSPTTTTSGVHRWVADDVVAYRVNLARLTAPDTYDQQNGVVVTVPIKGPDPKTQAVFTDIPWGSAYRAYVTALGNQGGVVPSPFDAAQLAPLNATPATTDFAFTTLNDVDPLVTHAVQVVLDDVPFAGSAGVTFAPPAPGGYVNPSPDVTGSAE